MQLALPALFAPTFFRARRPVVAEAPRTRTLKAGTTFALPSPQGQRVDCLRGCLWLTHDGDPKDIVLAAGEHYVADRNTRLLVHGLEDAAFRIAC